MRQIFKALILSAILVTTAVAKKKDKFITNLHEQNFDDIVPQMYNWLMVFYKPIDCPECKELAQPFNQAAKALAAEDPPIAFAKIDGSQNAELVKRYNITEYPTLMWFHDGQPTPYKGRQSSYAMHALGRRRTQIAFVQLDECAELFELRETERLNVVYFGDEQAGPLFDLFVESAKIHENFDYYMIKEECTVDHNLEWRAQVAMIVKYSEHAIEFQGKINEESLNLFLTQNEFPFVIEHLSKNQINWFLHYKIPVVMLYQTGEYFETASDLKTVFMDTALAMRSTKLEFTVIGHISDPEKHFMKIFDVVNTPCIRIMEVTDDKNTLKYKYEGDLNYATSEDLVDFLQVFLDGDLEPHYRSERPPIKDLENSVQKIVGSTWFDIVKNNTRDVLVVYWNPDDAISAKLVDEVTELARNVRQAERLVIGKYNDLLNENKYFKLEVFPQIRFYPKGNKEGMEVLDYINTAEALTEYLKVNSHAYRRHFQESEHSSDEEDDRLDAEEELAVERRLQQQVVDKLKKAEEREAQKVAYAAKKEAEYQKKEEEKAAKEEADKKAAMGEPVERVRVLTRPKDETVEEEEEEDLGEIEGEEGESDSGSGSEEEEGEDVLTTDEDVLTIDEDVLTVADEIGETQEEL